MPSYPCSSVFIRGESSVCKNSQSAIRNPQSGVTLIEMLVVISIIAIASGLVLPTITSGLDNLRLRSTAERLAQTFRYARERAIRQQTPCQVVVDPGRRTVELEDLGAGGERSRRSWELPLEVTVKPEQTRAFIFTPDGGVPRLDITLTNARGRTASVEFDLLSALPRVRIE